LIDFGRDGNLYIVDSEADELLKISVKSLE